MLNALLQNAGRATYHQHSGGHRSGAGGDWGGDGSTDRDAGAGEISTTDEEVQFLRTEVRNIMDNVVTASSAKRYTNGIVNFFIWLFDDSQLHSLFKDWFLVQLRKGHAIDQSLPKKKRQRRTNLQSTIKSALSSIICNDNSTHPFCFHYLNFDIFHDTSRVVRRL